MKKLIFASAMLTLASCSTPVPIDNVAACLADVDKVPSANAQALLMSALASPACVALGQDVVQQLITRVSSQHSARGMVR